MKIYFRTRPFFWLMFFVFVLWIGVSNVHAQHLKAFVGTGYPNITDGAFDGTVTDIVSGTGEWGNFLLLDFVSSDPSITVNNFTIDFGPSFNASISSVYTSGHNPDGATFISASLNNDVYTATFTDLDDSVNVLFIHFDFDQRSTGTGTPLGTDYIGATITATLSNGINISGTFDVVDFFNAFAQIGVPGSLVDVWARDCEADIGDVPSNSVCPSWWTSPDIFIDNDYNGILDAPLENEDNILRALVHNRSSDFAQDVTVEFYYRNSATGLTFPDGANPIGTSSVNVPANGIALTSVVWHNLEEPPPDGHWCIGIVLRHQDDQPITPAVIPYEDNNVACANIWFIAGRAGERMDVSFSAATGGRSGFGLKPWPREFILRIEDKLPKGWKLELKGAKLESPFTLQLGEEQKFTLNVFPPEEAKPHELGMIRIDQVDVETGKVVGGLQYNVYEDHQPPMPVDKIRAMVSEKGVVLTWEPIQIEEKTGLDERVAYYEILRNGRPFKKVIRDEDPFTYGMQWTDLDQKGGKLTYAIRVVDEGGNISELSPEVKVTLPEGKTLPSWICLVLLIIIIILSALLFRRKRVNRT